MDFWKAGVINARQVDFGSRATQITRTLVVSALEDSSTVRMGRRLASPAHQVNFKKIQVRGIAHSAKPASFRGKRAAQRAIPVQARLLLTKAAHDAETVQRACTMITVGALLVQKEGSFRLMALEKNVGNALQDFISSMKVQQCVCRACLESTRARRRGVSASTAQWVNMRTNPTRLCATSVILGKSLTTQLYARAALQVASKRKTAQSVRRALQGPSATARLSPA